MTAEPAARWSRRAMLLALGALPLAPRAESVVPAEVSAELPGARLQGRGRLSFLGLHVYDARLWVGEGFVAERYAEHALALEVAYARTLYGRLIAERSLTEMKRAGDIDAARGARWLAAMQRIFPDVAAGDRLTCVQRPGESAHFFFNAAPRGEVRDAKFARRFFGIWLAPQTSEPRLRDALLGTAKAGS